MRYFILFILSFTLLSCEVKIKTNQKKDMEENNTIPKIPFPTKTNYSKEYLAGNFWKCNYSFNENTPKYWVILPKNVKPIKIAPIQVFENLTNIGQYQTIDKSNYLEVWIFYEVVSKTIQPSDWLLEKLKISNESIIHQNIINSNNGDKYLDVLTSKVITNGENVISRLTVLKNDAYYFFIKVSCNEKDYSVLANEIRHITSNWNISD